MRFIGCLRRKYLLFLQLFVELFVELGTFKSSDLVLEVTNFVIFVVSVHLLLSLELLFRFQPRRAVQIPANFGLFQRFRHLMVDSSNLLRRDMVVFVASDKLLRINELTVFTAVVLRVGDSLLVDSGVGRQLAL